MSNVVAEDTVAIKVQMKSDGTFVVKNLQDKIKQSTDKIKGYYQGVGQTVKNVIKTIATVAASVVLVTSLSGAVSKLVNDTISFDREWTQVRTLLDESKVNVKSLRKEVEEMGGDLGTLAGLARGTYQMISSGQDAEQALRNIGDAAMFAQGGQVALRDAVGVGTIYLNSYGEAAGGLSHIYDVLWGTIQRGITTAPELAHAMGRVVPMANEAGLSIEELNAAVATMTQISGNTNETVTALRGILSSVIKPSAEAASEAERLGINFSAAGIKAQGFSGWLSDLVQKVQQGGGDIAKLFGEVEALNGIFQLSRNGLENYRKELDIINNSHAKNKENFEKWKQSFEGAWESMKNKLQAIFIQNILPILKDVATWISQNSKNISNFVEGAISGLKTVIGVIGQFKDVIIITGKAWITYFAISKINSVFNAFKAGGGVINQLAVGFVSLKKYGLSTMDSFRGAFRTATGEAFSFGNAIKKIPTSVKITVALIGAELVGRALAEIFDLVSDYYDKEMGKIVRETERTTGVTGKLNQEISKFVRMGESHKKIVEEIKEKLEFFGYTTENSTQYVKKLHDLLGQSKEWKEWQDDLKSAGVGVKNLSISFSENQQVYQDLAKTVGEYTQTELDSLIHQGIITETQKGKLLELQNQYKENQKVVEEQREKIDELASSMGILTERGYQEQSREIKNLLSIYNTYRGQINNNQDTLKTWIEKIETLYKTALPAEKLALEDIKSELIQNADKIGILGDKTGDLAKEFGMFEGGIEKAHKAALNFKGETIDNTKAIEAAAEMTLTWKESLMLLSDFLFETSGLINQASEALQQFGIISESKAKSLNSIGKGIGDIGQGFTAIASGNPFGIISGGISLLSGAGNIISGIIDLMSGASGELEAAERRLQGLSGTTEDWGVKVEELAKQLGGANSAGRAFDILLADIISNSNVTISNFDSYINKVREVVSTYEQGFATLEETQSRYGAAFDAILKKAVDLGLEGGHQMTGLILLAEEFGLKVKEVQEYLESNKKTAIEGYRQFIEAAFSDIRIGVLDEWLAFEEKVKNHQALVNGVQGVTDSLVGLSNTTRLTQEQYNSFQLAASDAYSSLISEGFTANEAMQIMQPMLERLAFLQQQYGLKVDDTTSALINQGIEAGLISEDMKTENQLMLEGFDRIVDRLDLIAEGLGVKIPDALGAMEAYSTMALDSISRNTGTWSGQLDTIYSQFGDIQDASYRLNSAYDDIMVGHSLIPLTQELIGLLDTVDSSMYTIGDAMKILDYEYTVLMQNMGDETRRFAVDAQGVIRPLLNQLSLIGKQTSATIGGRYGVYTEEEKQGMTAEFFQLSHLWQDSRATILQSEDSMRRFLQDVESLTVIEEAQEIYDRFVASMRQWYGNLARGRTWDEENKTWIAPVSAARGIRFVVPPGYEKEKGFPMYVHSGELVQVFQKTDTQKIIQDDMRFYPKVGSDQPTSLGIPTQTFQEFFTYPDYSDFSNDNDDSDIQLNDGIAPVFIPGKTASGEPKIDINVNLNISNIEIKIEQKGDSEIDREEMRQQFSEMLKDDFRDITEELAEAIQRKLKEKSG